MGQPSPTTSLDWGTSAADAPCSPAEVLQSPLRAVTEEEDSSSTSSEEKQEEHPSSTPSAEEAPAEEEQDQQLVPVETDEEKEEQAMELRPACLLLNTAVKGGEGTLIIEPRERSVAHYAAIASVRGQVVSEAGKYDDLLGLTILRGLGIKKCMELHYNLWISEPDNDEGRNLQNIFVQEHKGKDDRKWRRRCMRRYAAAMDTRFGYRGLQTYWCYGMVDEKICEAIVAVAAERKRIREQALAGHSAGYSAGAASSSGAASNSSAAPALPAAHPAPTPGGVASARPAPSPAGMDESLHRETLRARKARHTAKSASNYALRRTAGQQPGGPCALCWTMATIRTRCLVCHAVVCDACAYVDEGGTRYLLCRACEARRGSGSLDVPGRVSRHPMPLCPRGATKPPRLATAQATSRETSWSAWSVTDGCAQLACATTGRRCVGRARKSRGARGTTPAYPW